ncbi:hypothetical protein [Tenacibaculum sp. M341]|uniref:hypothetical protein n=1 Tax=Tenacibaculum sp. M341 TaxID=2530339 RepID=UPI001046CCEE|nr:hypothetical protein [Tenacibaculum sp. M341]TCI93051.1 hypothetical protein EYW44_05370 [Tenacibaculum sp. M341]
MKIHQAIFEKTEELLKKHLGDKLSIDVEKYDDGYIETHISIIDTNFWVSCDDRELTVGSGFNHRHFNPEFDDINEIIEVLLNSLTKRKRITEYYKGKFHYKTKTEIESKNGEFSELSTSLTWLFPFWKKTKEKVVIEKSIIDQKLIEKEINEIKNYAQQFV